MHAARGQDYCLDCGLPLTRPSRSRRARRGAWREDWVWPALAVLVLGAVGALAAVAVGRSDDGTATLVATRVRVLAPRARTRSLPVLPATTVPALPSTLPTTTSRPASTLTAWTLADGYTVVLVSLPRANGRASAEEEAKLALAQGLQDVGVLDSNRFRSLTPGYFVVFSGIFASSADAAAHLAQADAAGFHSAYERRVSR